MSDGLRKGDERREGGGRDRASPGGGGGAKNGVFVRGSEGVRFRRSRSEGGGGGGRVPETYLCALGRGNRLSDAGVANIHAAFPHFCDLMSYCQSREYV